MFRRPAALWHPVPRLALSALVLVALAGAAAAGRPPAAPCDGCVLAVPRADHPVPLVVVLHGDREHARDAAARWRGAVARRGWALLALECPCKQDSFWQWDGDPAWVMKQVAAVEAQVAIDPARVYLVGWSGGASYIGWRAQAWAPAFAAVVLHGGGIPPARGDCPAAGLPAYFLVGDRNPLHHLAKDLRAYLDACHEDVTWDLVRGADHDGERRALTARKAASILDWLAARARAPAAR